MYELYARKRGWRFESLSVSATENGGYKEASASLAGDDVYGTLKFESGVHRVQRVPATETQGRVHTSTASVAVLPQAEEVDVVIRAGLSSASYFIHSFTLFILVNNKSQRA